MIPLRDGPPRAGEVADLTMWRSLRSARAGEAGYMQPKLPQGESRQLNFAQHYAQPSATTRHKTVHSPSHIFVLSSSK